MKKCCFIIPYFGKLPNYFPVFLKTCAFNKDYDWLIFSDDCSKYELPINVKIINLEFVDLKEKIKNKFKDFEIALSYPYKLCDYKPAYGYIFEEYLKDKYQYWGHCDLDILVGNLDNFLLDMIDKNYDKILCLGHMILYKNTYENNRVFMEEYNNKMLYKESFQTNEITTFDETYNRKK